MPERPAGILELQEAGYVLACMTLGEGAITLDELVAVDHEKLGPGRSEDREPCGYPNRLSGTQGCGIGEITACSLNRAPLPSRLS